MRAWTWDCFYSQKSQRLSLMYHSRTWFQILRYNYDHTLLLLYTYIACTFIVPWRGCHCSSDICQKPDWITLWPCHMSASHAQAHPHVARYSSTWLQESLSTSSEHFVCPSCLLHIVIWLWQSSDFLISNVHLTIPGLPHFHVKLGVNLPVSLSQAARIRAGGAHWALSTSLPSPPPQTECLSPFTLLFPFPQQGF